MAFKLPFQNLIQKNASEALFGALKDAAEGALAQAKDGADFDDNGVPDVAQNQNSVNKVISGVSQAIAVGGFVEFIAEIQEFAARIQKPEMKEGVEKAIEGAHEIYAYISAVAGKFMPKKVAEGEVAADEAAQA